MPIDINTNMERGKNELPKNVDFHFGLSTKKYMFLYVLVDNELFIGNPFFPWSLLFFYQLELKMWVKLKKIFLICFFCQP